MEEVKQTTITQLLNSMDVPYYWEKEEGEGGFILILPYSIEYLIWSSEVIEQQLID